MSRYLHHGVVGVMVAVVLVLACQTLVAPAPAHGQAAAEDAKAAALKDRNRLWEETRKLRAAGKTAEALAAAEAMLAIERKVLREDDADLAVSLGWLAELQVEREDFAAAKAARREVLDILRKRLGESDWRVVDARRALEDVERLAGMDRDRVPAWPRRNGSTERSWTCTEPASTPKPFLRRVRPWRSARRCWASATPTPPPA